MAREKVTWGELGCPRETGLYRFGGEVIRVKNIHIMVAEDDPSALFTVVALRPPLGPPEYHLGAPRQPIDQRHRFTTERWPTEQVLSRPNGFSPRRQSRA